MAARTIKRATALAMFCLPAAAGAQTPIPAVSAGHLYFEQLRLIDRFDTVTIFMTDGPADEDIAAGFEQFARRIGTNNGATQVDARNYDRYSDVLNRLRCPAIGKDGLPAVLFEAKADGLCKVFTLEDPAALRQILLIIERNMACPRGVTIAQARLAAYGEIKQLAGQYKAMKLLFDPAVALLDWASSRLSKRCGI